MLHTAKRVWIALPSAALSQLGCGGPNSRVKATLFAFVGKASLHKLCDCYAY